MSTLGQLFLVLCAYVIFCFFVWKKIWFEPFGGKCFELSNLFLINNSIPNIAELPIDKNINIQEMNRRRLYAKTKTFAIFKKMFLGIVYKLEMEYWVLHCGTDGYLYLLFQRQMLKLSVYLSVIMFLFSSIMNLDAEDLKNH